MKRIELHIEHSYENRFVGRHRVLSDKGTFVFGTGREADIRLLGDQVGGVHACVEWQDGQWILSDLGSEHGTWLHKKPIVHQEITETITVLMGKHAIKLTPVIQVQSLFEKPTTGGLKDGELFHQVIIRKHDLLVNQILTKGSNPTTVNLDGQPFTFSAPKDEQWITTTQGDYEIRQRMVREKEIQAEKKDGWVGFIPSDLRAPVSVCVAVIAVFATLLFFMPQEPNDTMVALKPENQNQYTRMIYDAKKVKKQREESQKLTQKIAGPTPEKVQPKNGGNQKMGGTAARVVNNIKSSGLSALIGKISARAARNTELIQSAGVTPDVTGAGMALGVGRTIGSAAPNQVGLGAGEGHKLGGVGTNGKGGGSGDYKGFGGLAVGNVGNANVGVIEEETEVDGGLDKDVIARYIKSQLGQIRYCYERQLSANPDLYGKVMIKFTIGATGAVVTQNIGSSSLSNAMVEGCILRRVAGWQFPTPKGGTQVLVSYPFLFKSTR